MALNSYACGAGSKLRPGPSERRGFHGTPIARIVRGTSRVHFREMGARPFDKSAHQLAKRPAESR